MTEELYPGTILVKVFYRYRELEPETLIQLIQDECPNLGLRSHRLSLSKNKSYQVLSLEIYAERKVDIEDLYRKLGQNPLIKMVL